MFSLLIQHYLFNECIYSRLCFFSEWTLLHDLNSWERKPESALKSTKTGEEQELSLTERQPNWSSASVQRSQNLQHQQAERENVGFVRKPLDQWVFFCFAQWHFEEGSKVKEKEEEELSLERVFAQSYTESVSM